MNLTNKVETFGVHLFFDGYNCNHEALANIEALSKFLNETPTKMGMHPISEPIVIEVGPKNRKDPGGISGFVMIAESHISFHTFPEKGFVTADVYTCQNDLDSEKIVSMLSEVFQTSEYDTQIFERGTKYPS